MSLVNDMLNDLEQRQRKGEAKPQLDVVPVGPTGSDKPPYQRLILLSVSMLVVFAVLLYWWSGQRATGEKVIEHAEQHGPAVVTPLSAGSPSSQQKKMPLTSSEQLDVEATVVGDEYQITISARELNYRIEQDNSAQLLLRFDDAVLPNNTYALPDWIEAVNTQRNAGQAILTLLGKGPLQLQSQSSKTETLQRLRLIVKQRDKNIAHDMTTENTRKLAASDVSSGKLSNLPKDNSRSAKSEEKINAPENLPRKVPVDTVKKPLPLTPEQLDKKASIEARQSMRIGDYNGAEKTLSRLLDGYPDARESQIALITLLLGQQRYVQADTLLQKALDRYPNERRLLKLQSRSLMAEGELQSALRVLEQIQVNLQADSEHVELMAAVQQRLGQHNQAAQYYGRLVRHKANNAAWWVGLAVSLEALQQYSSAKAAYVRATNLPLESTTVQQYVQQRLRVLESMRSIKETELQASQASSTESTMEDP